jgi:hypothetical protein
MWAYELIAVLGVPAFLICIVIMHLKNI